jgi:hypothetical protein
LCRKCAGLFYRIMLTLSSDPVQPALVETSVFVDCIHWMIALKFYLAIRFVFERVSLIMNELR